MEDLQLALPTDTAIISPIIDMPHIVADICNQLDDVFLKLVVIIISVLVFRTIIIPMIWKFSDEKYQPTLFFIYDTLDYLGIFTTLYLGGLFFWQNNIPNWVWGLMGFYGLFIIALIPKTIKNQIKQAKDLKKRMDEGNNGNE